MVTLTEVKPGSREFAQILCVHPSRSRKDILACLRCRSSASTCATCPSPTDPLRLPLSGRCDLVSRFPNPSRARPSTNPTKAKHIVRTKIKRVRQGRRSWPSRSRRVAPRGSRPLSIQVRSACHFFLPRQSCNNLQYADISCAVCGAMCRSGQGSGAQRREASVHWTAPPNSDPTMTEILFFAFLVANNGMLVAELDAWASKVNSERARAETLTGEDLPPPHCVTENSDGGGVLAHCRVGTGRTFSALQDGLKRIGACSSRAPCGSALMSCKKSWMSSVGSGRHTHSRSRRHS